MKALNTLISALIILIAILNIFGGIVSGIWLAVLSEWRAIGIGVASILVSSTFIGYALMPSMLFLIPADYCAKKNNINGMAFFTFLSLLYITGFITLWCMGVLYFFGSYGFYGEIRYHQRSQELNGDSFQIVSPLKHCHIEF